jgi:ABC-2 type transport system ATP-binding protein
VRRSIGYVAQGGSTVSEATVDLEIVSQAQLYGMGRREAEEHGRALLKALDLDGVWRRQCGTLSGGQRRRLDIVMGLIHRPRLVFLDEPSTGLDPQSRANLWSHIRKLRDELGTTVFLTTHYMDEADSLSDRLLIIDQGRIVAGGTSAQLKQQLSGDSITLTLKAEEDLATAGQALKSMDGVDLVSAEGNVMHLQVKDGSAVMPAILRALSNCGVEPIGVETARPTLDDVFLSLTGRSLRD